MNISIPDSWLREYLATKAAPAKIAEALSLTSCSVEKVDKIKNDHVYYIEITTNRVDMMSVWGIAREAAAILPEFGIKARLKKTAWDVKRVKTAKKVSYLDVNIAKSSLCPRFTTILLEIEKQGTVPKIIKERLAKVGIRSLNPVIDVTNYLMFELGQPMHVFDYEKIGNKKMVLRESIKGEKITTLDGIERVLPSGAIVIEDGDGRLIDLCGTMGGVNSCVSENTTKVLLFVQNYDPQKIRKSIQALNFRTDAATRFEKGIDSEMVLPALLAGVGLYKKILKVKRVWPILDIYGEKAKPKTIEPSLKRVQQVLGVKIKRSKVISILTKLGFEIIGKGNKIKVKVPSWRAEDVMIEEDLIEEVARVYGYYNLPNQIPKTDFLLSSGWKELETEKEVKKALSLWGFTETITFSMISEKDVTSSGFQPKNLLKIANPLVEDCVYMRTSLISSLVSVIANNEAYFETINIFELAKVYLKTKTGLPDEPRSLVGLSNKLDFRQIKGVVEVLLEKFNVNGFEYKHIDKKSAIWQEGQTAQIIKKGAVLGYVGVLERRFTHGYGVSGKIVCFELDFEKFIKNISQTRTYKPISKYPPIIQDLTVIVGGDVLTADLIKAIYSVSKLVEKVELIDKYENSRTFRIYFLNPRKNLTDREVAKVRANVIKLIEKKFAARIREA